MSLIQWNCRGLLRNCDECLLPVTGISSAGFVPPENPLKARRSNFFMDFHHFPKDKNRLSQFSGYSSAEISCMCWCLSAHRRRNSAYSSSLRPHYNPLFALLSSKLSFMVWLTRVTRGQLTHPLVILGDFIEQNMLWRVLDALWTERSSNGLYYLQVCAF